MKLESKNLSDDRIIIDINADLEALIPRFLANRQDNVSELVSAVENEDFESIQAVGHVMKGVGGGYGFDFISVLGNSLEKAAVDRNLDEVQNLTTQLADYLKRVEVVISSEDLITPRSST